jgi:TatD DNase family protein
MLIDSHCHLDFESFEADLDQVVDRARGAGVSRIIAPALDVENCPKVLSIAARYKGVFAAVGVHPNSSASLKDDWLSEIETYAGSNDVVAIGEIGLDYYRDYSSRDQQLKTLEAQLELAKELNLPVILHNRDSDADLLSILRSSAISHRENPGVFHSFSTEWETATAALDLGFYLGFSGPVTFKKADELREIVSKVPADRILVETDAPFLAPQKYRGKRNEPAYVTLIAERIASIRGVDFQKIARQTTENAIRLFGTALR